MVVYSKFSLFFFPSVHVLGKGLVEGVSFKKRVITPEKPLSSCISLSSFRMLLKQG